MISHEEPDRCGDDLLCADRGEADVLGLVLLAPVMIALALLVVFLGRQVDSQAQVRSAAESAAQSAALQRSPVGAVDAARMTAMAMLVDHDTCLAPEVAVDTSAFAPGGTVAVTVTCEVSTRGLDPVGRSGRVFSATAMASIDPYRAVDP